MFSFFYLFFINSLKESVRENFLIPFLLSFLSFKDIFSDKGGFHPTVNTKHISKTGLKGPRSS